MLKEEKIPFGTFVGQSSHEQIILDNIKKSDIVIFPELYFDVKGYNVDLINIIKVLRSKGFSVLIIDGESNLIEKNDLEIYLNIGIILSNFAPIIATVLDILYKKDSKNVKKDSRFNIEWYSNKHEKRFSIKGEPKDIPDILKELKRFDDD